MDQERSDPDPQENPIEQDEGGAPNHPTQTDPRMPPRGLTAVGDEGEDQGLGERPSGSEDGAPGGEFEPTPTQEDDHGPGSGGD